MMSPRLPDELCISHVNLRVRNLAPAVEFYHRVLGLTVLREQGAEIEFSAPGHKEPLLILTEEPNAPVHRPPLTGLFHVAIRFPTRRDLAQAVRRLVQNHYSIDGASNHLVSEAIYLRDPEDNGIELYADVPREQWRWRDEQVVMATESLDLRNLLATSEGESVPANVPPRTGIGHMHLQVADLGAARHFFHEFLNLDITCSSYSGALFFSVGGYHHHIGANIWGRRGVLPPEGTAGLISYRMEVREEGVIDALYERAQTFGYEVRAQASIARSKSFVILDPSGTWVEITAQNPAALPPVPPRQLSAY